MNDLEFEQRAYANPYDETSEFLTALQEKPERRALLDELLNFDKELQVTLGSVSAPESLKHTLLNLPGSESGPSTTALPTKAANDSRPWIKLFPLAASFILAIGILFSFWPASKSEFELEIFAHIYHELGFLETQDTTPLPEANRLIEKVVGSQFQQSSEMATFEIKGAKRCWVSKEDAIHMVVAGNQGPVTVMLIPNEPVKNELSISDERFEGVISPTTEGNIVVVGEKKEPVREVSQLLANNINW